MRKAKNKTFATQTLHPCAYLILILMNASNTVLEINQLYAGLTTIFKILKNSVSILKPVRSFRLLVMFHKVYQV